jgi:hypothetical protein
MTDNPKGFSIGVLNSDLPRCHACGDFTISHNEVGCMRNEIDRLRKQLGDFKAASLPFVGSFERLREAHTSSGEEGRASQDFYDRNEITPSGTKVGDWRRLADFVAKLG